MGKITDWDNHVSRRLRLRDLRIFFAAVQSGSMAKAAENLGVSQPAISQVIADLEFALGVRLLDRSRRGVEPTIYGRALLKRGLVIFDELKQSVRDIEFLSDPTSGELRIGCPESIAASVLSQVILRFSKNHPRVVVYVNDVPSPAIRDPGLRDRSYDLVIARLRLPLATDQATDDLNIEPLFDDPLVIAAGPNNPWARRRKINLAELIDEPWILSGSDTWVHACMAEAFQARRLPVPKTNVVTLSLNIRTDMLANGPFITALPRSLVQRYSVKALPVDLPVRPWPVAIITLKNRTLSPVVERFIECAREVATSMGKKSQARKL